MWQPKSVERFVWVTGLTLIAGGYLWSRTWLSRSYPLFIDEGVYLWYAESVLGGDLMRGFGEGKPLIGWVIALPLALGVDPIWSARLPHLLAGLVGLGAAMGLAFTLAGRTAALMTGTICLLLPSLLFHERMATPDIFMGAMGTLALWLALQGFRRSAWWAIGAGIALVAAVLAKSPVGFFFYLGPLLFFGAAWAEGQRPAWRRLALLYALPLVFVAAVIVIVGLRVQAGAYPPGFGLHEVFAKTTGAAPLLTRMQDNVNILVAWFGEAGNWLFALLFVGSGILAMYRRCLHIVSLAILVGLWFAALLLTAVFLPERYWTPVLYIAAIVVGWGVTAVAQTVADQWGGRNASKRLLRGGFAGLALFMLAVSMVPPDLNIMGRGRQLSSQHPPGGLVGAAHYLAQALPGDDSQVILVHVGDYTRLKAYLPPTLHGRVRQVHLVQGQSQGLNAQMIYMADWARDKAVTYVVVESSVNFGSAWQASFPEALLVAEFPVMGTQYPTQVWRLARPQ